MEDELSCSLPFLFTFLFLIFTALSIWMKHSKSNGLTSMLPPGPPKLPIIGHLHHFIGTEPHRCLARLARKYGSVMLLQLGEVPTVVISSPEAAKEVMKTHDSNFCERPHMYALQFITYNFEDLVFSRGDHRTEIRKICVQQLLSQKRVQSLRPIREEEIANLVRNIASNVGLAVNLKKLVFPSSQRILFRAAFGEKFKQEDTFGKLVRDIIALFGGLNLVDLYPSLKVLHLINAMRPTYKTLQKEVDKVLENIIEEHRATRSTTMIRESEVVDLVHVLLDIQDHGTLEFPLSTSRIKAILMDVFVGGGESTATFIEWAMSELIRNPKVLERAQAEVRHVFGSVGDVNESSIHDLKYLNSVIKETLRLHAPAPLMLPRECQENCEVNGYMIPAKYRVIINAWAIGRNQSCWSEAEKFNPERFSDSSIDCRGTDFELIPFGAGRRICPGMSYGIANVELIMANLLYHFDWKLPDGMKPEELDMTDVFGGTLRRKSDLCLVPIPHHVGPSE